MFNRSSVGVLVITAFAAAHASAVAVTNYNWLQLRPDQVTTFVSPGGGNGYGTPDDFRWGNHVWIPDGTKTGNGTLDYFGGVRFDQPRSVKTVDVSWWTAEGTGLRKFYIDGSTDGVNWTNIGAHEYASLQQGNTTFSPLNTTVDVTDGTWQYVRVRTLASDPTITGGTAPGYVFGSAGRGGPGIYAIEPSGDGDAHPLELNWANSPNLGTTIATSGMEFGTSPYTNGKLFDNEGQRTGSNGPGGEGVWAPGDFAQVNLMNPDVPGSFIGINRVIVVWEFVYAGTSFGILYSKDGVNFQPVPNLSAPTQYVTSGATEYTFDLVAARAIRIVNATGGGPYEILNQIEVFGVPEPASTMGVLLIGAVGMMRRRR